MGTLLTVVDWAAMVRSQPVLVASDAVHATPQGYAVRGQRIAAAIASCGGVRAYGQATGAVPGD
jgi:hypothetical protein